MSSDLKAILSKVIEEDYNRKELEIENRFEEKRFERFKFLLQEIAKTKKWDLAISVEGAKNVEGIEKYEKDLNLLERGNIIKGEMKLTEHNTYREYQLTEKGTELLKKMLSET